MPLPSPNSGESQDDFMSRCMGSDDVRNEFPENDQRAAVCLRQFVGEATDGKAVQDGQIEVKSLESFEIKDETKGEVVAVVATLGVVDHDGDVILPGAIPTGSKVKISRYGHSMPLNSESPVGKGTMSEENGKAVFRGRYFMSTEHGRDAFNTIKELEGDTEWSFGYPTGRVKSAAMTTEWKAKGARRIIAGLEPFEVSPVFLGAGINTGTLAVKQAKEAAEEAEAEAAKAEEAATAAKRAEEEAHAAAETAKQEAERAAAAETEAVEVKRLEAEAALKAQTTDAMEEYHRVQRTLKRLGVT